MQSYTYAILHYFDSQQAFRSIIWHVWQPHAVTCNSMGSFSHAKIFFHYKISAFCHLFSVNTVHMGVVLPFTTTTSTTSVRSWNFAEECSCDPLVYVYDGRRPKNTKSFHHSHLSVRPFWHLKRRIGQFCKQMFLDVTPQFQTVSSGLPTRSKEQGIHHCVIRVLVFRHSESMDQQRSCPTFWDTAGGLLIICVAQCRFWKNCSVPYVPLMQGFPGVCPILLKGNVQVKTWDQHIFPLFNRLTIFLRTSNTLPQAIGTHVIHCKSKRPVKTGELFNSSSFYTFEHFWGFLQF